MRQFLIFLLFTLAILCVATPDGTNQARSPITIILGLALLAVAIAARNSTPPQA